MSVEEVVSILILICLVLIAYYSYECYSNTKTLLSDGFSSGGPDTCFGLSRRLPSSCCLDNVVGNSG